MKITDIINRRRGTAGAWRVKQTPDSGYELWHYGTRMLAWTHTINGPVVLDYSTGWGSVSDQNGMNKAFTELGVRYRYHRDARGGGARIEETTR